MKRVILLLVTLCLLPASLLYSQNNPRIAVIPLNAIGVSAEESQVMTELFETGLVNTESFHVIEQNRVNEIVEAQKYSLSGCTDEECAIELGRLIAADNIVLGTFSSVGGKYIINAKIIDVTTGENIKADKVATDSIDEMTEKVELLAFMLAGLTYREGGEEEIAKEFGEVFVLTDPDGADIFINGVRKGTSPELFSKVPLGQIRIEARKGDMYAEKLVNIAEGMGEIELVLKQVFGNLFIKSSEPEVDVFLDGEPLGKLGTGLFRDLAIGSFTLRLLGDGLFWEDTVEISAGESSRVEAYPRAFGTISYMLPEGVIAEVKGSQFREVIRGSGELEPVWEGTYAIAATGEKYVSLEQSITVSQGQTAIFRPEIDFTNEYTEELLRQRKEKELAQFSKSVENAESTLISIDEITQYEIGEFAQLVQRFEESEFTFPDLESRAKEVLSGAKTKLEEQKLRQDLNKLLIEKEALQETINESKLKRRNKAIGGV